MNTLRIFGLLAILLFNVMAVGAQESQADVAITLQREVCFGTCPVYSVTILEDGTVLYNGERFVDVTGEQTGQIDPATVEQMVQALADAGYFEWDEEYTNMTVSDLPYITTSVTRDGETHTIRRYAGDDSAPVELPYLEMWIDLMANTGMWTGVESDISNVLYGANAPVVTLQRGACFGFCPIYSVAAFEDGTIVYMGIANVDNIGVTVYQSEPFAVESVVDRAALAGYFDWQDSYDQMMITDQSTVITSVQTDEQYKRISRYLGDPTAPVGLVWVEDSIDQLVDNVTGMAE